MLIKHARPTGLGFQVESGPGGRTEYETFTCGHCEHVTTIPHRADPASCGGLCKQCMKLVCPQCAGTGRCTPLEKRLEESMRGERLFSQVLLG